jgi:hypothetical protein
MIEVASGMDYIIASVPELKSYTIDINKNKIDIALSLVKKEERKRDSFTIQTQVESGLNYLKTQ